MYVMKLGIILNVIFGIKKYLVVYVSLFLVPIQGFKQQALAVSTDPEHRFELALQLGELKIAYQLAVEAEVRLDGLVLETNPTTNQTICSSCNQMGGGEHKTVLMSTRLISVILMSTVRAEMEAASRAGHR